MCVCVANFGAYGQALSPPFWFHPHSWIIPTCSHCIQHLLKQKPSESIIKSICPGLKPTSWEQLHNCQNSCPGLSSRPTVAKTPCPLLTLSPTHSSPPLHSCTLRSLSLSLTHTHTHSLNLALSPSHSLSHSFTLSLSHTHTHRPVHTIVFKGVFKCECGWVWVSLHLCCLSHPLSLCLNVCLSQSHAWGQSVAVKMHHKQTQHNNEPANQMGFQMDKWIHKKGGM